MRYAKILGSEIVNELVSQSAKVFKWERIVEERFIKCEAIFLADLGMK